MTGFAALSERRLLVVFERAAFRSWDGQSRRSIYGEHWPISDRQVYGGNHGIAALRRGNRRVRDDPLADNSTHPATASELPFVQEPLAGYRIAHSFKHDGMTQTIKPTPSMSMVEPVTYGDASTEQAMPATLSPSPTTRAGRRATAARIMPSRVAAGIAL